MTLIYDDIEYKFCIILKEVFIKAFGFNEIFRPLEEETNTLLMNYFLVYSDVPLFSLQIFIIFASGADLSIINAITPLITYMSILNARTNHWSSSFISIFG